MSQTSLVTLLLVASWSSFRAVELGDFWMTLNQEICFKFAILSNYWLSALEQTGANLKEYPIAHTAWDTGFSFGFSQGTLLVVNTHLVILGLLLSCHLAPTEIWNQAMISPHAPNSSVSAQLNYSAGKSSRRKLLMAPPVFLGKLNYSPFRSETVRKVQDIWPEERLEKVCCWA